MPEITYRGISVECESGEILRTVLRNNAMSPHSGMTEIVNCGGNSTCGTCAVRIVDGPVGERTPKEQARLAVSTYDDADDIRLACRYRVTDDVTVARA